MTGDTANAFVQVNTVIEVDKIWEIVYPRPTYGLARPKAVPHGGQEGALSPDKSMTVHTGFGGRDASKGADFY